jgi:hypothetical protein
MNIILLLVFHLFIYYFKGNIKLKYLYKISNYVFRILRRRRCHAVTEVDKGLSVCNFDGHYNSLTRPPPTPPAGDSKRGKIVILQPYGFFVKESTNSRYSCFLFSQL